MHIVHGELRKAPFIKSGVGADGQSTMFGIELSEIIKDYKSGEKSYTNYKAVLFAKSQAHIDHYNQTLVLGNFVVVTGEKLKVNKFTADSGVEYITLDIENARLEGSGYMGNAQPQQQAPQQSAPQQQQNNYQQPQQQPQGGYQQQQRAQQQPQQNQGGYQQAQPQQAQQQQQGGYQQQAPQTQIDDDIPF